MKKRKLLKSILIFSILFPTFAFYGCASKQDASEIPNAGIALSDNEIDETIETSDEIEETTDEAENIELDESENDKAIEDVSESENDLDELPEIEEPEIFDAELPEEIEEEPPVEIEEEKIIVEEVEPIVEIQNKPEDKTSDTQTSNQDTKPQIGVVVTDDEVEDVSDTEDLAIDITDEDESLDEEITEIEIIPSRSVTLRVGEYLEIDYPGRGWIFMGATDGSKNLTSAGRKLGDKDTNFTLLARNEGTSVLHFFKEDVLAGVYIDDYIEVTVEPTKSSSKTRVKAPSYAETVPKQPEKKSTNTQLKTAQSTTTKETETKTETPKETQKQSATKDATPKTEQAKIEQTQTSTETNSTQTISAQTQSTPKVETPAQETKTVNETPLPDADELLKSAKTKIDAKNYDSAKNDLELFLTVAESDRDEALYLLGQIYESNSKSKDIKKAIESYEKLMSNYPTSKFWDDANKRAIYLKRFYINVR